MNQPINNERWIGIEGEGAWLNGKKISTRNCTEISNAVMCASSPFYFHQEEAEIFKKICSITKYQRLGGVIYGGDCYSYVSLASGFVDLIIDPGLKVYDYAALLPIIKMAGGIVSDWEGKDLELKSNIRLVACGDKNLHQKIIKILNS